MGKGVSTLHLYNNSELDRIWIALITQGTYYGSFKDHILSTPRLLYTVDWKSWNMDEGSLMLVLLPCLTWGWRTVMFQLSGFYCRLSGLTLCWVLIWSYKRVSLGSIRAVLGISNSYD